MVLENGAWTQDTADETHQSSSNLAKFLLEYLSKDRPVYDFGCGKGYYLNELAKQGFKCVGVEGFQLNNFLHDDVIVHDLSKPFDMGEQGHVISLEVGEHIPKSGEQSFLDSIARNCKGKLIFSWALPGQPGVGHVNCQPQRYIIREVERRGFKYLPDVTLQTRAIIEDNVDWFRRTLLIFERADT